MDIEQYSEMEITYTCNISNYSSDGQQYDASKIELVDPAQSEPQPNKMLQNLGVEKTQGCDVSNYSSYGQQDDASKIELVDPAQSEPQPNNMLQNLGVEKTQERDISFLFENAF